MLTILESLIPQKLLDGFVFAKDNHCLAALRRLAKLAKKHDLQETLEAALRRIGLTDTLTQTLTMLALQSSVADVRQLDIAQTLVFLLENSTELFLADLFREDLTKKSTADCLCTIISLATNNYSDSADKITLLSLLYQVFQVCTEVPEVAEAVLRNDFYGRLMALPTDKHGRLLTKAECPLIYVDKMLIVVNLAQHCGPDCPMHFDTSVRQLFNMDRFVALKHELSKQKKLPFSVRLAEEKSASTSLSLGEINKSKDVKKIKKDSEHASRIEWIEQIEADKHMLVVLARLYELVAKI